MEMRELFRCSTLLALLCLQSVWMAHGQNPDCPNRYVYTQQPPEAVVCNPYNGRTVRMECSVVGPNVGEIRWYFSTTSSTIDENTNLLTNSSKYTLVPVTITNGAGVRLTVHNLTEAEDAGYYWCQAYVSDSSQILSESSAFLLRDQTSYLNFPCPGIFRNSNTRCATLMEIPTESPTDLVTTSYSTANPTLSVDVQPSLSSVYSSSSITTPSLIVATTTQLQSSDASSTPSPVPTLMVTTDSTFTNFNTVSTPTEQSTTVTPPRNPSQSSELILYAVLGLVGFLILICVSLAVVILVLCRKRCQRIGLEGSQVKEAGFDRLSNQSDPFAFKRRAAHTPYHPDITMQVSSSSQSRNGSGEYAEIGPALVMLQSRHHETINSSHDYSEIPELPPDRRRTWTHNMATATELQQTGSETLTNSENPYDLPVLPPPSEELDNVSDNVVDAEEEPTARTDTEVQSPDPHKYHELEETPTDSDSSKETPISDGILSVSSPNPPTSPHSYHVLEGLPSDAQHLCHSHAEEGMFQLQTIPEHPYHVLEEQTLSSQVSHLETSPSNSQTLKEATPGFTDPEVSDETFDSNDPKSDLQNREYDRLVGPQHLYHILEKSSSALRPVICEFPLTEYNHLDCQTHATCQLLVPKTDESVVSNKTTSSSDSSFEAAFDDPQYLISPRRRPISIKAKSDVGSHCRGMYGNGRLAGHTEAEAPDLTKYLGDYERDPSYVALLHKRSADKSSDVASHHQQTRRSSLPDLPHVYQALESTTMDPRQQYERLRKQQVLAPTETAI